MPLSPFGYALGKSKSDVDEVAKRWNELYLYHIVDSDFRGAL